MGTIECLVRSCWIFFCRHSLVVETRPSKRSSLARGKSGFQQIQGGQQIVLGSAAEKVSDTFLVDWGGFGVVTCGFLAFCCRRSDVNGQTQAGR
jgi:hypothetical protein